MLPDVDGLTVARRIRAAEKSSEQADLLAWTPIVFLSAATDDETLAQGILAGGDDYLTKPISEVVLAKGPRHARIAAMREALRDAHRQLTEISYIDGLTHVPNRRRFDQMLAAEWQRCIRQNLPSAWSSATSISSSSSTTTMAARRGCLPFSPWPGRCTNRCSASRIWWPATAAGNSPPSCRGRWGGGGGGGRAHARFRRRAAHSHEKGVAGLVSCSFGVATAFSRLLAPAPAIRGGCRKALTGPGTRANRIAVGGKTDRDGCPIMGGAAMRSQRNHPWLALPGGVVIFPLSRRKVAPGGVVHAGEIDRTWSRAARKAGAPCRHRPEALQAAAASGNWEFSSTWISGLP